MTSQATDVVIIGGGIAGSAAAYYLAEQGISSTIHRAYGHRRRSIWLQRRRTESAGRARLARPAAGHGVAVFPIASGIVAKSAR